MTAAGMDAPPKSPGHAMAVRLRGVEKSFGGVKVLSGVDLDIGAGEVHAVVGANGAGKSTLGKIIGGTYARSAGTIEVFGTQVGHWTPDRALRAGIAMIHQELQLVPELTVMQNVLLGIEGHRFGILRTDGAARYRVIEGSYGFGIQPHVRVGALSIADQQKVEIMRALARDARVIIMDEPTSSLTADEVERLHHMIQALARQGRTIVYVTHFLDHVLAQCDQVTVMREGRRVTTRSAAGLAKAELVELMLGSVFAATFPELPPPVPDAPVALELRHLSAGAAVRDVSLTVRRGEIVGLAGLVGSGRSETVRAIFGADRRDGGEVLLSGVPYQDPSIAGSIARSLVMVPEERRAQGLVMTLPVRANMTLPHLGLFSRAGLLAQRRERARTADFISRFGIVPGHVDGAVHLYSGGNQQKVLLAKWLVQGPEVIMLDEPTRGVDIGARRKIYDAIAEMAASGMAVLLISSDLEEVLGLSHRCYLIRAGRTIGEIDPTQVTFDAVMHRLFATDAPAECA
jgi:ribose transport system ATP-binding protein